MIPRHEFDQIHAGVHHLNTIAHAPIIEGLIKWLRPAVVIEIGIYKGALTAIAARALQEIGLGGYVYAVDNFTGQCAPSLARKEEVQETLVRLGVAGSIEIMIQNSQDAEYPLAQMAIVDGHHHTEPCMRDVQRMVSLGVDCICLHDTVNPDWVGPALAAGYLSSIGYQTLTGRSSCGFTIALK